MKITPPIYLDRADYLRSLQEKLCADGDSLGPSTEEAIAFANKLLIDLKSAEQQYADLTAALPQMLWLTRPDGFHVYFNEKWVEYTGRSVESCLGFGWLNAFHPDDRERTLNTWRNATSSGQAYEIDYRLQRADGTYGWVLGRALPLRDASGEICKWFGSCTDIDSQKKSEKLAAEQAAVLALANEQLIKTEQLKSDFFSNVSHELRTPLTLLLAPV
jgi:PAS domain S-box-containing protein